MTFCGECGIRLADAARFCPECGTPVPARVAPARLPDARPSARPMAHPHSNTAALAVGFIALALIAGGITFLVLRG